MRIRTETLLEIVAFTIQTFLKLSANILILFENLKTLPICPA